METPQSPTQRRCRAQAAAAHTNLFPVPAEGRPPGQQCHPNHTALGMAHAHSMAHTPGHSKLSSGDIKAR